MVRPVKILVFEPHAEVRALLGHVVERIGHEPLYPAGRRGPVVPDDGIDVLLLEPADPAALAAAARMRALNEELPIVCASIDPDSAKVESLRPLAYLLKPFGLEELEHALCAAVDSVSAAAELHAPVQ